MTKFLENNLRRNDSPSDNRPFSKLVANADWDKLLFANKDYYRELLQRDRWELSDAVCAVNSLTREWKALADHIPQTTQGAGFDFQECMRIASCYLGRGIDYLEQNNAVMVDRSSFLTKVNELGWPIPLQFASFIKRKRSRNADASQYICEAKKSWDENNNIPIAQMAKLCRVRVTNVAKKRSEKTISRMITPYAPNHKPGRPKKLPK